jgi:hypothetical protein
MYENKKAQRKYYTGKGELICHWNEIASPPRRIAMTLPKESIR